MIAERPAARVALLADTFHEINGAARTCREWDAYARRQRIPLLSVRWGPEPGVKDAGPVRTLELRRSRWAVPVDADLSFDLLFSRVLGEVRSEVRQFKPDAIHITSPGDLGVVGAIIARQLEIPLVLSWHTNLHEFAARRLGLMASWMGKRPSGFAASRMEQFVLDRVCWFFGRGSAILAPNPELVSMLRERTGKPVYPMGRGIDTKLFRPDARRHDDSAVVVGYVGRLTPEKNLRVLAHVAERLRSLGIDFRVQITGSGSEREWLEAHIPEAMFTGVLTGESLARAYAALDVFLFPSRTDTFGNVIQEAFASGVPAVAMDAGGPRFIVRDGVTGLIAADDSAFCEYAVKLALDTDRRRRMGLNARTQVESQSWDRVFEEVYDAYARLFQPA